MKVMLTIAVLLITGCTSKGSTYTVEEGTSFDAKHGDVVNIIMEDRGNVQERCADMGGRLLKMTCMDVDF